MCRLPILGFAFLAATVCGQQSPTDTRSTGTLTLLFENDLNFTQNAVSHPGLILASQLGSSTAASQICTSISESLLDLSTLDNPTTQRFKQSLTFQIFEGTLNANQLLWVKTASVSNGLCTAIRAQTFSPQNVPCNTPLAALCTQTAPFSTGFSRLDNSAKFQHTVQGQGGTFTGFRDFASFRFEGIPYANAPARWTRSTIFSGTQRTFNATVPGSACVQAGSGSEDCLFLNVFTPRIPGPSTLNTKLKPVMVWIHGGAFINGQGADSTLGPTALVSRGDVVFVTINYRLSTIGFLALNDGVTNGNFGLGDQIVALQWVKQNIATFGGDPNHITVFGQSAGASSVRFLLASPLARGLFQGAMLLSCPGGFGFANTFTEALSIQDEVTQAVNPILARTNCTSSDNQAVLDCLKNIPASTLVNLGDPAIARFPVVDGSIVTTPFLSLAPNGPNRDIHTVWGMMSDDGAPFIQFPRSGETVAQALQRLIGLNSTFSQNIANSGLFPTPTSPNATLNVYNVSARVTTDGFFRCIIQATINAAIQNGVFKDLFAYQFDHSYQTPGFDPNAPVCDAPITPSAPLGDPDLPFFHCHSGELFFVFGSIGDNRLPFRNLEDFRTSQTTLDAFSAFGRTFDPNPSEAFLTARGFTQSLQAFQKFPKWVSNTKGAPFNIRQLNGDVITTGGFTEMDQCDTLGFPEDFFL